MKKNFLLGIGLVLTGIFSKNSIVAQVVGGRGNSDMTPKTVGPEKLSGGTFSGDVNLFTGDYNATQPLGTVSTPGGLSYTLNYSYSAAYTTSGTSPIALGIPYGDGWSLNIPTISVESDVFNNFLQQAYCVENGPYPSHMDPPLIHFDTQATSSKEGDVYWFSPVIDVPGVASGRAVFKYYDASDKAAVFALNSFSTPAEIRYYGDHWTVIAADGTRYNFYTTMLSNRAPVNARTLFYDQTDIIENVNEVLDQDVENKLETSVQNAIMPKRSYTSWYCDIISHNNYASQTISFTYEKYGAFNYFKEFTQPQFEFGMTEFNNELEVGISSNYDFTAYTDILLTKISSFAPDIPVEELRLTYETDFDILASSTQFIDYRESGSSRLDALYSMKVLNSVTGDNEFTNWKRYNHIKKNINTTDEINGNNPYVTNLGYRRENVTADEKIPFSHGFLESQRFGQNELFPGDIYEIRTKIRQERDPNENDNHSVLKRNSTFDISVVTGKNGSGPASPSGTDFSAANTDVDPYYTESAYNTTRGVELFSTFNMAVKWHMGYREAIKETSNFFVMPNTPEAYQGINIQIGAGNSDNYFGADPEGYSELTENGHANAKASYAHRLPSTVYGLKSAANIPHNFGIGLPWGIMIPLYERMSASSPEDVVDNVLEESAFHFWWARPNSTNNAQHRPTKVDDKVFLDEFELIRYSKNPLMLKRVELYRLNGEAGTGNDEGWRLISSKALEYKTKKTDVLENFEYYLNDPLAYKSQKKQIHILLTVIRDIPVGYTGDTLKTNPVFLEYVLFEGRDPVLFDYQSIYTGAQKFLLSGVQDHLGDITRIAYYPINHALTAFTVRYNNPVKCVSSGRGDYGTYQAMTIHPVVHYISKNDESNQGLSSSSISTTKRWEYIFDPLDLRGISSDFKLPDDHFRSQYSLRFKLGFAKTIVHSPALEGGEYTYSVYEHYTHNEDSINLENHLLFGKLKSVRVYDHTNRLHEEKLYKYGHTLAFKNAYVRPNLFRSQLNYEEKDYNRVLHPYEYEDYYNNEITRVYNTIFEEGEPTEYVLWKEGVEAYPYLEMPIIKGSGVLFETPRFLEFEYFNELTAINPPYMFDSYFVKLREEISRVYEDYTYLEDIPLNPAGIGQPVNDNPSGPGKVNSPNLPNDGVVLGYISGNTSNLTNKLINESPLSETVLREVLTTTRLTFDQKSKVLKAQNGLSNDLWERVLQVERNFSPHQLMGLVDVQPYFSDQVLKSLLLKNHADFDRKVFEAMMTKNTRLSNSVMLEMMPASREGFYMNGKSFMDIFTRQEHLTEELLVNIAKDPYLIPGLLPELLIGENVTPEVYKEIIKNPRIENEQIAIIIEQDPVFPREDVLLLVFDRQPAPSFEIINRIIARTDRPLEELVQVKIRLSELIPNLDELLDLLTDNIPVSRFCQNPQITGRHVIESKTEYEYYEADYEGISDGPAYKTLLGITDIPGRTIDVGDFFGGGNERVINHLHLKHEPSWQVFRKKITSPQMPGMQNEEQYFYTYDLKNRYDRHWYNYDILGNNRKADIMIVDESGNDPRFVLIDTIGFSMEWNEQYSYNSGGLLPRFDAMVYSQQYDMRTTPFQQTSFTRKPGDGTPVMKSEYFHYEARWDIDATPDYNYNIVEDLGVDCDEEDEEEEDPPTPCETCIYEKFISSEAVARSILPNNYCLWEGNFFGYYMCPSSFETNPCVVGATKIVCYPLDPDDDEEDDGPSQFIKLSTLLNKSLQLRSSYVQVDDIVSPTQNHFEQYQLDNRNTYVADFWIDGTGSDPNGLPDYVMLLPFDNLMTAKILDRNRYLQPELVENQAGIQTKYDYEKPELRRYVDDECPGPESNQHRIYARNIGQPVRITVGYERTDAMTTAYQYTDQGLVASLTLPSGHVMDYTYDGFLRLIEVRENGSRLLSRTGYNNWNQDFSLNFQQRRDHNYVTSILYNNYVDNGLIVDTNQREMLHAYIDPLGREHSVTRNYGNNFLYSGSLVYDNWSRVTHNYKPTAETRTDGLLLVRDDLTTPFAGKRYENNPKNRLVRAADFDVPLADQHTSKAEYKLVNYAYLSCELDLSSEELQLLVNSPNKTSFRFMRTRTLDQDDKELVEYSNAFGQKIASLSYDDNAQRIVTLFGYDSYGNLERVINPEKQVARYQYNMLGLLVKETTVDSGEKRYMYNRHLKVSAIQDALHRSNHIPAAGTPHFRPLVRKFDYDDYGRLVKQYVRNVSPVYDIYAYRNVLLGDAQGNPVLVNGSEVYFDYRFSHKSSLDWLYMYRFWNGSEIVWTGPGAAFIQGGEAPSAIEIPDEEDDGNAPDADDDFASGPAGQLIPVEVLANDSDPDGDFLNTYSIDLNVELPGIQHQFISEQGSWTASDAGVVYFLSELEFAGAAEIHYTVDDMEGNTSEPALIQVTVQNPDAVNLTEKTWVYGVDGSLPTVGKLLSATSYSNTGFPIQEVSYGYNAEDRVSSQDIHFHPSDLESSEDGHIFSRIMYPQYNYRGSLLEEKIDVDGNNLIDLHYFYTYDALNRLTEVYAAKAGVASKSQATLMASYQYDDATGLLKTEKQLNGTTIAQEVKYQYDVRDRLTQLKSQLLQYDLFYDNNLPPSYNGQDVVSSQNYNGNINAVHVSYKFAQTTNAPSNFDLPTVYGYQYDPLNRLKAADAIVADFVADASPSQVQSSYLIGDESYSYDRIGNIKTLQRHIRSTLPNQMTRQEVYAYKYASGSNRLLTAQGIQGTAARSYGYDANGNVTLDVFKNMTVTQYGRAAYAYELTKGTENISYLYDVNDLRMYKNAAEAGISKAEYYLKDALNRDVAIYNISNNSWTYNVFGTQLTARINKLNTSAAVSLQESTFYLYDHLGNTRVTYQPVSTQTFSLLDEYGNTVSVTSTVNKIMYAGDYFPYGKIIREFAEGAVEKYLTTYHERDEETANDYRGARYYDSDIARFLSTDPWQAKYPGWSTYNYVMGNPLMFVDPTGKGVDDPPTKAQSAAKGLASLLGSEIVQRYQNAEEVSVVGKRAEKIQKEVDPKLSLLINGVPTATTSARKAHYFEKGEIVGTVMSISGSFFAGGGGSYTINIAEAKGDKMGMGNTIGGGLGIGLGTGVDFQIVTANEPGYYYTQNLLTGQGWAFNGTIGPLSYSRSGDYNPGGVKGFDWKGNNLTGKGGTAGPGQVNPIFKMLSGIKFKGQVSYEWTQSYQY